MTGARFRLLLAVALVAFVAGIVAAVIRGYWGVSADCREWVNSHGYQLVHDDWWAKSRGCVARTPAGGEVSHSEEFGSKAAGWAWQFAIFACGGAPAAILLTVGWRRWGRGSPGGGP